MKKLILTGVLFIAGANCITAAAQDKVKLAFASVLQNNMVVQQNKPFKVWGVAPPRGNRDNICGLDKDFNESYCRRRQ